MDAMNTSNKRVLIVDDDSAITEVLTLRCQNLGLSVESASDGLEALTLIVKQPPDLVILDINMPAADGLSVAERLAQDNDLAPLPVIFLTGRSDEETVCRCKEHGAHYVFKDIDAWNQLKPIVCELLDIQSENTIAKSPPQAGTSGSR